MSIIYKQRASATRRIKKVHKKARWVGFLYLLGTIALTVLSLLGCLNIKFHNGDTLSVLNFYKPFLWIFKAEYSGVLVFLMFLIMTIRVIVNCFKSIVTVRRVFKKNEKNTNACNRNVSAMEDMGEIFAATFSHVLVLYALMYVFSPAKAGEGDVYLYIIRDSMPLTLMGVIACAFATIIHFVAGAIGSTSSLFIVSSSIEERRREEGVLVFVMRSFIKVATAFAMLWLFLPASTIHEKLPMLFEFKFDELMPNGDIMPLLVMVLQIAALVLICLCIKRATHTLEFNLIGMEAYGMRRFSVYVLIAAILNLGIFVLCMDDMGKDNPLVISHLVIAIIGIMAFVLEFIVKPRTREKQEIEKPEEKTKQEEQKEVPPQQVGEFGGIPSTIDLRIVLPQDEGEGVNYSELPTKWEVVCPNCGKSLAVKEAPYHRCPACGKVFRLQIGKVETGKAETLEQSLPQIDPPIEEPVKGKKAKKEKKIKFKKEKVVISESAPVKAE